MLQDIQKILKKLKVSFTRFTSYSTHVWTQCTELLLETSFILANLCADQSRLDVTLTSQ